MRCVNPATNVELVGGSAPSVPVTVYATYRWEPASRKWVPRRSLMRGPCRQGAPVAGGDGAGESERARWASILL